MSEKKSRVSPGEGRVQYAACREEILDLIGNKFYPLSLAYRKMIEDGKITMSYSAFTKIYKRDITTDFFEKKTDIKRDQNNEKFSDKQKTIDTKNKTSSPPIIGESKVKDPCNPDSYLESKLIKPKE